MQPNLIVRPTKHEATLIAWQLYVPYCSAVAVYLCFMCRRVLTEAISRLTADTK